MLITRKPQDSIALAALLFSGEVRTKLHLKLHQMYTSCNLVHIWCNYASQVPISDLALEIFVLK